MISVHTALQPGVANTFLNEQNLYLFIFQMNVKCRECCSSFPEFTNQPFTFIWVLTISQSMHVTLSTYYCEAIIPSN